MDAKLHIAFPVSRMTRFQIRRFLRTNFRKAEILTGSKVGQSVGLLEIRFVFYFLDTRV
jgi:hypothetical protein